MLDQITQWLWEKIKMEEELFLLVKVKILLRKVKILLRKVEMLYIVGEVVMQVN